MAQDADAFFRSHAQDVDAFLRHGPGRPNGRLLPPAEVQSAYSTAQTDRAGRIRKSHKELLRENFVNFIIFNIIVGDRSKVANIKYIGLRTAIISREPFKIELCGFQYSIGRDYKIHFLKKFGDIARMSSLLKA